MSPLTHGLNYRSACDVKRAVWLCFWGWWDHTFHVYQLCTRLCMCRDVRRRTQCERRFYACCKLANNLRQEVL